MTETSGVSEQVQGASADEEIRIGISACLLGQEVRFDGGHKRDRFATETLSKFVQFVPVCPEMEIGLGTPRETLHLEGEENAIQLVTTRTRRSLTDTMNRWAQSRVEQLERSDLCGFILKKDSPSCGMARVRLFPSGGQGVPSREGVGLFARALMEQQPSLPIEEEGRLQDPKLREHFCERVFAYRRLKTLFAGAWEIGGLLAFHAREVLLLRAHDPVGLVELDRLLACARGLEEEELERRYREGFMASLRRPATRGTVTSVLQHAIRSLADPLDEDSRQELLARIAEYRRGIIPLLIPVTLLAHHARQHRIERLLGQTFLEPHPRELLLRDPVGSEGGFGEGAAEEEGDP
jgi:uncharacterized protein YbbK (DUF523 family)/uncharacterized protein YbgA (DUF1722 family)